MLVTRLRVQQFQTVLEGSPGKQGSELLCLSMISRYMETPNLMGPKVAETSPLVVDVAPYRRLSLMNLTDTLPRLLPRRVLQFLLSYGAEHPPTFIAMGLITR